MKTFVTTKLKSLIHLLRRVRNFFWYNFELESTKALQEFELTKTKALQEFELTKTKVLQEFEVEAEAKTTKALQEFELTKTKALQEFEVEAEAKTIKALQNIYFKNNFLNSKKMIVFVNFEDNDFCGGVMAIFTLAEMSRKLFHVHGCDVLHATSFTSKNKYYISQPRFTNDEVIYRLEQVMDYAKNLDTLIIHIPELLMETFTNRLTSEHKETLKKVKNLQINVLNQNIEVFSPPETWAELRTITVNITQTTGFDRYTTQKVCNKYQIPLYRLIGYCGLYKGYEKIELSNKEKLFIYSPDPHRLKESILTALKEGLPDFTFQQIQELTFDEFMHVTERAMFSLTFGEGFDGYFTNMYFSGGLGFTVYNETFFPSTQFLEFPTVYKSYEGLAENIIKDVRYYLTNPEIYKDVSLKVEALNIETAYNEQLTYNLLEKFYKKEPTFLPEKI